MNNFLYNLKEKYRQFMVGRYGPDQLYSALLIAYVVLIVLNFIFRRSSVLGFLFYAASLFVLVLAFARSFSKNIYKRSAENAAFLKVWGKVKNFFVLSFSMIRDFPTRKYSRCPHCRSMLRLPRIRGKHTVRCPQCSQRFETFILIGRKNNKSAGK